MTSIHITINNVMTVQHCSTLVENTTLNLILILTINDSLPICCFSNVFDEVFDTCLALSLMPKSFSTHDSINDIYSLIAINLLFCLLLYRTQPITNYLVFEFYGTNYLFVIIMNTSEQLLP